MLVLASDHLEAMYAHGETTFPKECCGLLLGHRQGDDRIVTWVCPAANLGTARDDRFELDPADRKRIEDQARCAGLQVVGVYHSHPDHDAYWSETDRTNCEEYLWGEPWVPPTYAYPVLSIKDGRRSHWKCFLMVDGQAVEEPVELTGTARDP